MSTSSYYYFVKIDSPPRRKRVKAAPHSVYREVYIIHYRIRTLSPVHVGSGIFKVYNGRPISINARDIDGKLIIPASTMKGVIAHYYLALIGSTEKTSGLFGYPGYMSRIFFEDVKPSETEVVPVVVEVGASWKPARRPEKPSIVKLYQPNLKKIKEKVVQYLECIPENTVIGSKITIVNSFLDEIAEVLLSMGYTYNGIILIGYGKPRGLGKTIIEDVRIEYFTPPFSSSMDKTEEVLQKIETLKIEYRERIKEVFKIDV